MSVHTAVPEMRGDGVLVAPRHCDRGVVPDLLRRVKDHCAAATGGWLVVDLSAVETFEGVAFRALLWARRYAVARGVALVVVPPREGVLAPQQSAILHDLFGCLDAAAVPEPA